MHNALCIGVFVNISSILILVFTSILTIVNYLRVSHCLCSQIFFLAGKINVNPVIWLAELDAFIYCFFNRWVLTIILANSCICCISTSGHQEWWNHCILFLWRIFVNHLIVVVLLTWYRFDLAYNIGQSWINHQQLCRWRRMNVLVSFLYNLTVFELIMMTITRRIFEVPMIVFLGISLTNVGPIMTCSCRFYWYNIFVDCKDSVV